MPRISWDDVGERTYESGLDRGVLYLSDGSAIPWNGLTSVVEAEGTETEDIIYEGTKIATSLSLGVFSGTITGITCPKQFYDYIGSYEMRRGFNVTSQKPKYFGMSYRTRVGNDVDGSEASYKIHVLFNVLAVPSDKTYASETSDPSLVELSWDITATPEPVPGIRPTAHFVIDSKDLDPWLLEDVEAVLYGSDINYAGLPSMAAFVEYLYTWARIDILDNGNGTWTAIERRPGFISVDDEGMFEIVKVKSHYLDEDTYEVSTTYHKHDAPKIYIHDNGDGTWSANTGEDNLVVELPDGMFEIRDATIERENDELYRLSDTLYD